MNRIGNVQLWVRSNKLTFILLRIRAIPEKNTWGGEDGRRYIFLWVVGAHIFQIIWVLGV